MVSVKATEVQGIPRGVIMIWSGTIATIPDGWALCDGSNNTPDLSGLFVRHADGLLFHVGDIGGTSTHNHTVAGTTLSSPTTTNVQSGTGTVVSSSAHVHTFSTISGNAGTVPPYMALCYIMKL